MKNSHSFPSSCKIETERGGGARLGEARETEKHVKNQISNLSQTDAVLEAGLASALEGITYFAGLEFPHARLVDVVARTSRGAIHVDGRQHHSDV